MKIIKIFTLTWILQYYIAIGAWIWMAHMPFLWFFFICTYGMGGNNMQLSHSIHEDCSSQNIIIIYYMRTTILYKYTTLDYYYFMSCHSVIVVFFVSCLRCYTKPVKEYMIMVSYKTIKNDSPKYHLKIIKILTLTWIL